MQATRELLFSTFSDFAHGLFKIKNYPFFTSYNFRAHLKETCLEAQKENIVEDCLYMSTVLSDDVLWKFQWIKPLWGDRIWLPSWRRGSPRRKAAVGIEISVFSLSIN